MEEDFQQGKEASGALQNHKEAPGLGTTDTMEDEKELAKKRPQWKARLPISL